MRTATHVTTSTDQPKRPKQPRKGARTMIDADAAAEYIGFSTGYLHRITLAGKISIYEFHNDNGRRPTLRYAVEELDAFLDQYHVPATAPAAAVGSRRRRQPARSPRPVTSGSRELLSARGALADERGTGTGE